MKKRITLIALLVAAVMLMTGCGKIMDVAKSVIGKSETAKPAETKAPEEPSIPEEIGGLPDYNSIISTEKPAEEFVGDWVNAVGNDKVKVNADGTVEINGVKGRVTYSSSTSISMMALDWIETDEKKFEETYNGKHYRIDLGSLMLEEGFLYGYPANADEDTIWKGGLYYRKGEENPLEKLFGTWTLMDPYGEGMKYKDKAVEEITVSPDGKLLINGESIELEFSIRGDGQPMFYASADDINGYPEMEGEEMILQVGLGDDFGRFIQGLKKAELSLENWKDFFEARISYSVQYDDWGEVKYVSSRLYLLPKEGITIMGFAKERFEVVASPAAFGMIEYNLKTNEYELREMTAQEKERFGDEYFAGLDNLSNEGRIQTFAPRNPKMDTDPVTGYGFLVVALSEDEPVINGDMVTAPMVIDYKMEILRIIGTIYYK